jgi:hypothetical protein
MDNEQVWKDIPGYDGLFQASEDGFIKVLSRSWSPYQDAQRFKKEHLLSQFLRGNYYCVTITINSVSKNKFVHILVADAFLDKIDGKDKINHKDGNKLNNNANNLERCTQRENVHHAIQMGLYNPAKNGKKK